MTAPTRHAKLLAWVNEIAEMTKPIVGLLISAAVQK